MYREFLNRKIFNSINLLLGAIAIIAWQIFYICFWFYSGIDSYILIVYVTLLGLLIFRVIYLVVCWVWKNTIEKVKYFGFIGGKGGWYLSIVLVVVELILCSPVVFGSLFLMSLARR